MTDVDQRVQIVPVFPWLSFLFPSLLLLTFCCALSHPKITIKAKVSWTNKKNQPATQPQFNNLGFKVSPLLREEKNWRFRFKRNYGAGGAVSRRSESETNNSIIVIFSRQTITKLKFQTWANRNVRFIFLGLKFHPYQLVFAYLFIYPCQFLAGIQQQREPATVIPW